MRFLEIINQKRFTLITIFLFFYVLLNLLDGERGLISYYKMKNIKNDLIAEKVMLSSKIDNIERKNNLLTNKINLDYLETLIREKFMVGKTNEKIFNIN